MGPADYSLSLIHISQGRRIAGKIIVSHGILFDFLREELALPEERANEVACQIEHIIDVYKRQTLWLYIYKTVPPVGCGKQPPLQGNEERVLQDWMAQDGRNRGT